ncbi:MAG TPA: serine/threonine-protein kinase [Polyangiaceae bacterium]|nr:serine/threonine-protein kinase [Polyangiaceae bacterium]
MLPKVGEVVANKYRIEGPLGKGGMAVVFAAHHVLLDKPVAMKFLSPDLPRKEELFARFLTEAQAAARVDSPHVARVMDVGALASGLPYMVMERLDGCDLEELLTLEKRLAIGDAVDYLLQALQGLAHAHTLGIVHRDLKPSNLFLAHQSDGTAIVKILDFGIAKLDTSGRRTQQQQALGSPLYMSPEHIKNEAVDSRADIWSIGVVAYELLTGRTPFEAEGIGETLAAVLQRAPKPIRALRPEVPEELDAAILRCLRQSPEDRYADAAQLARAIAPWGTGACSALVDSIEQTLRQQLRRYSGEAIILRPASDPRVPIRQPSRPDTTSAPTVSVLDTRAPTLHAVTEDSIPELRPKRFRWLLLAMVLGAGAYGAAVFEGLLPRPAFLALPVASASSVASALAELPSASASAALAPAASAVRHATTTAPTASPHPSHHAAATVKKRP